MSDRDQGLVETVRDALRGEEGASGGTTFMRGLTLGALLGAAVAGSAIWQRRGRRRLQRPATDPGHRDDRGARFGRPGGRRARGRRPRRLDRRSAHQPGSPAELQWSRPREAVLADWVPDPQQGLIRQRARMTHQPASVDAGRHGDLGLVQRPSARSRSRCFGLGFDELGLRPCAGRAGPSFEGVFLDGFLVRRPCAPHVDRTALRALAGDSGHC